MSTNTTQRILASAIVCINRAGLENLSMEMTAQQAGLTRMTVYRHFSDKNSLVSSITKAILTTLERTLNRLKQENLSIHSGLEQIIKGFGSITINDFAAFQNQLQRKYPEIYETFHLERKILISAIFDQLIEQAKGTGQLRPGLNEALLKQYFKENIINFMQRAQLDGLQLSPGELFHSVADLFLYGILTRPEKENL